MKDQILIIEDFEKNLTLLWRQACCRVLHFQRFFPQIRGERMWHILVRWKRRLQLGDQNLIHRLAEEFHQFLIVGETREHRDHQRDHDSHNHHPQVLKMFEERLFMIRVGFFPELDDFFE